VSLDKLLSVKDSPEVAAGGTHAPFPWQRLTELLGVADRMPADSLAFQWLTREHTNDVVVSRETLAVAIAVTGAFWSAANDRETTTHHKADFLLMPNFFPDGLSVVLGTAYRQMPKPSVQLVQTFKGLKSVTPANGDHTSPFVMFLDQPTELYNFVRLSNGGVLVFVLSLSQSGFTGMRQILCAADGSPILRVLSGDVCAICFLRANSCRCAQTFRRKKDIYLQIGAESWGALCQVGSKKFVATSSPMYYYDSSGVLWDPGVTVRSGWTGWDFNDRAEAAIRLRQGYVARLTSAMRELAIDAGLSSSDSSGAKTVQDQTECRFCSAVFKKRSNLLRHVRAVHMKSSLYQCDECDVVCSSRYNLNRHKQRHGALVKSYDLGKPLYGGTAFVHAAM